MANSELAVTKQNFPVLFSQLGSEVGFDLVRGFYDAKSQRGGHPGRIRRLLARRPDLQRSYLRSGPSAGPDVVLVEQELFVRRLGVRRRWFSSQIFGVRLTYLPKAAAFLGKTEAP